MKCPCKRYKKVFVWIAPHLSHTGKQFKKKATIDRCIAPFVKAFQKAKIDMTCSCCGHGKDGEIILLDGTRVKFTWSKTKEKNGKNKL